MVDPTQTLSALVGDIRQCKLCDLPHDPRPVVQVSSKARICIAGQAPGTRVHKTGVPFNDPSGDRLRDWLAVNPDEFYDPARFCIIPMGFCFPGLDAKGGDLPPRKECAVQWRETLFEQLPQIEFTILIGSYAQAWHLGKARAKTMTETVANWQAYLPDVFVMPHPSWRNNAWLKRHPWFEETAVPELRALVRELM